MAYRVEENGDIVIDGFEKGIGDDPYSGLTDCRNMNIISVPGEAAVNFSTSNITSGAVTGQITSASGSLATYTTVSGTVEGYLAIYLISTGSYSGLSIATPYWIDRISSNTIALYTDYARTTTANIGGSGVINFEAYQMGYFPGYTSAKTLVGGIQYFAQPTNILSGGGAYYTFGVDGAGQVWGNQHTTGTNNFWTYTGNPITDQAYPIGTYFGSGTRNANGNGLVYWRVTDGTAGANSTGANSTEVDYLFVFRNSQIDYMVPQTRGPAALPTTQTWTVGWNPTSGASGQSAYLTNAATINISHDAMVSSDGRVYFCNGNNIQKLFQAAPNTLFQAGTTATYTYSTFNLLPVDDFATCLEPFGTNILIGAQGNLAYQWNTFSNLISNYIYIAEPYVSKIVTVNTNAYMFAGNRGRIYVTNGVQADLWKKLPDHLQNTIEPKYQWGGATATKNQLYFSFKSQTNDAVTINTTGGLWAIDLNTEAMRITNQLSYGTYAGYASAIIPQVYNPVYGSLPQGTGLFTGWYDGDSLCGVDIPNATPYTGSQATLTSDMIPIGTALNPNTSYQLEFKLSTPLLVGESMELLAGSALASGTNPTFVTLGTVQGDGALISGNLQLTVEKQQWMLFKSISKGISSSPSFNRLKELRIIKGNG